MQNYLLTLSYDGTRYRGWQRQGNTDNTIQAKAENALGSILGQPIELNGSGRTDAGVHARMQTATFRADTDLSETGLLRRLREALPEDIGALSLEKAEPRLHARLSCTEKTYVYRIWNSETPNVFQRRFQYQLPEPLELAAMAAAAERLCGKHDYRAFSANHKTNKSTVRTVYDIGIQRIGDEIRLTYTGNGFLYNMVRILTGTLLEVGRGLRKPEEMTGILESLDRSKAGPMAPAKGLTLWQVRYDGRSPKGERDIDEA